MDVYEQYLIKVLEINTNHSVTIERLEKENDSLVGLNKTHAYVIERLQEENDALKDTLEEYKG
jgi:hypothetical protein